MRVKRIQEASSKVYAFTIFKSVKDFCVLEYNRVIDSLGELIEADDSLSVINKRFLVFDNDRWQEKEFNCIDTLKEVYILSDTDISDKPIILFES